MKPIYQRRWRRCLKCNKSFRSKGPYNRLCTPCNESNAGVKAPPSAAPRWNGAPMVRAAPMNHNLCDL